MLAMPRPPARKKREKGAAILETSLVLLTLLAMVIFIMNMGQILLMQQFMSEC